MNIEYWTDLFDNDKNKFDYKTDSLESNNIVLMPGRFYILKYKPKNENKECLNTRPVILSLGLSKKDPESFLCVDLCLMPRKVRIKFIQMFYDMFKNDIDRNIKKYPNVSDADKQEMIKDFNYQNLSKIDKMFPVMNAIKRYKIGYTLKIFSISYTDVFKIIGNFADENWFINGNIAMAQNEFMKKSMKGR